METVDLLKKLNTYYFSLFVIITIIVLPLIVTNIFILTQNYFVYKEIEACLKNFNKCVDISSIIKPEIEPLNKTAVEILQTVQLLYQKVKNFP